MPIHGLTRTEGILPRLGELRKGAAKGHNRPGVDQDFFRFTAQDEPELEQHFTKVFGPAPRKIPCFLPYQYPDECFEAWNYTFRASGIQVKCDGLQVCAQRGEDGHLIHYSNESAPPCMAQTGCYTDGRGQVHRCQPRGMLHIVIPSLMRYGTVAVLTGSKVDISHLSGSLVHLFQKSREFGIALSEIPMQLTRHKMRQSKPMPDGSRRRVPTSFIRIEILPEWVSERMIAATTKGKQIAMTADQELRLALPGREDEVVEDVEAAMLPEASSGIDGWSKAPDNQYPPGTKVLHPHTKEVFVAGQTYNEDDPVEAVPQVTVAEDETLPVEEESGASDPSYELQKFVRGLGFVDEHEGKYRMLLSLILHRAITDWSRVKDDEIVQVLSCLSLMQKTLPSIQDNINFVQEIKERFQVGAYTLDKWNFEKGLKEWMELNYPPEQSPQELADAVPQDDLPF